MKIKSWKILGKLISYLQENQNQAGLRYLKSNAGDDFNVLRANYPEPIIILHLTKVTTEHYGQIFKGLKHLPSSHQITWCMITKQKPRGRKIWNPWKKGAKPGKVWEEVSAEMMQQAQGSQSRLEQDRGPGGQPLENNLLDYLTR